MSSRKAYNTLLGMFDTGFFHKPDEDNQADPADDN